MKFLIIIGFVAIIHAAEEYGDDKVFEEQKKHIIECGAEFKVTNETAYYELRTGEIPEADVNETMQCYINCLLEKSGLIKDGKFQEDATLVLTREFHTSEDEEVESIKESCRGLSGSNKCETAFKLHLCFLNNLNYVITQVLVE